MAKRSFLAGATSQTIDVFIQDSSSTIGAGLSGLAFNTSGLKAYYRLGATGSATQITLATQTVGGAWSSGGFVEIDSTNMKGAYRVDVPNAALASTPWATLYFYGATNMAPVVAELEIVSYNPFDGVRLGLTALPNAVAGANGGLPLGDASGRVDLGKWLGTAVTAAQNVFPQIIPLGYQGDFFQGGVGGFSFVSLANGVPTTLSGSPVVTILDGAGASAGTGTLTTNVNSVTGLNLVTFDTTSLVSDYTLYLSAGTVGGVTVVGHVVGDFSVSTASSARRNSANASSIWQADTATMISIGVGTMGYDLQQPLAGLTGTLAAPTGAPPSSNTLAAKVGFLYEALRNKITVSGSTKTFFNDANAAQWSKALSDDGTTYTEAKGS